VEFRLIDGEMLVNGNRFPVVKMQWIEGQSLDKYVETNLYDCNALHDLISRLIIMVRDLEQQGIAHGDLQHGNILVKGREPKLVDYDGMFVPVFKGKLAPELGLPSYQHPRRDESFYDQSIDRFPLLVMCTALCALATDPSLWYEFSTGDNILFTRRDFENPKSSQLFDRLRNLQDGRIEYFLGMLAESCARPPAEVPLPKGLTLGPKVAPVRPWWVTVPAPGAPSPTPVPPTIVSHSVWSLLSAHLSFAAGVTALTTLVFLYSSGIINSGASAFLFILTTAAYLLERWNRFGKLPVFARRRKLSERSTMLRSHVSAKSGSQAKLKNEHARLSQLEAQEKSTALKKLEDEELARFLSAIDISRLGEIPGIGDYIITNLRLAGIENADDLRIRGAYGVTGIGYKRRAKIEGKLSVWKAQASRKVPKNLPPFLDAQITSKYAQQRKTVQGQVAAVSRDVANLQAEISKLEWELRQLYVPSFGQFLRHHF
jgi:serine/threonine protein kinase